MISDGYPMGHAESLSTSIQHQSKKHDYSWEVLPFPMIILWRSMPTAWISPIQESLKTMGIVGACFDFQWLSYVGACRKYEYIHPGPSKTVIIAETCFSSQWSSCGKVCRKLKCIYPEPSTNYDYSWGVLQLPRITLWSQFLWWSKLKKSDTAFPDHLKAMTISETRVTFQWTPYSGACWKVWVHPSRTI